jgi:hypothetical protein
MLIWILRILLAFYFSTGGAYMMGNYRSLATAWALQAMPPAAWIVLGLIQIIVAVELILPWEKMNMPDMTSTSAYVLAALSLMGIGLYIAYSGFPGMLWGIVPAVLSLLVAWKTSRNS